MDGSLTDRLLKEKRDALITPDPAATNEQRRVGKLTARERASALFDLGTFVEIDTLAQEAALVAGYGQVGGRPAFLAAQDITAFRGALSVAQARKMQKVLDMAERMRAPLVLVLDSRGTRVTEGAEVMAAMSNVYARMARLSGVVPLIAVIAGPCVGIAAHFVALADLSVAVEKSCELLAAPRTVLNAVHETSLDVYQWGGAGVAAAGGSVSMVALDERAAFALVATLLKLLPSANDEEAPFLEADDINRLMVAAGTGGAALVADLVDMGSPLELYAAFGPACRCFLARLGGHAAGIVVSDPGVGGGRLDAAACDKAARFVNFLDCYSLPIVTLMDSEGLTVPRSDGQAWLMGASSRLLAAYAEATVPKLAVITGKAVGPAYLAMGGKNVADIVYAWPGAFIAPLTVEAMARTLGGEDAGQDSWGALEAEFARGSDGFAAAGLGLVDDVIEPVQTRKYLISALEMLLAKREPGGAKKHSCRPL